MMETTAQKNLFVAAGAGTGKTTRLAQEYLKRLLMLWLMWYDDSRKKGKSPTQNEPVERLLAITFTEKASSEMKTRIRQLAQKIQSGDKSELVTKLAGGLLRLIEQKEENKEKAASRLSEFLVYLKKNLHKGDISTIHAFCARVLREHPAEARVDPEFAIIEERVADELLRNAVETCALTNAGTKTVSYLLQQMGLYGRTSRRGGLVESMLAFIKALRSHAKDISFLQEKLFQAIKASADNFSPDAHFQEAMQGFPLFAEQVLALYGEEKKKKHCLDYEDLQQKAYEVLQNFPPIRASLKQLFSFILVDEFQDINAFQRDIIFFLAEKKAHERRKKSLDYEDLRDDALFVVGDAKQSIYGFRGADVSVFAEAREKWDELGWTKDTLQTNFRSRSPILDFVNEFFPEIMTGGGKPFEVPFREDDSLVPAPEKKFKTPQVFRLHPENKAASQCEERENEADAIARQMSLLVAHGETYFVFDDGKREKKRILQYGDMALLLRSLSSIVIYQNALKAHGIPYHLVRGKGFYQSQEVLDVLNTLRAMLHSSDEISLCGFLRSQFVALSDDLIVKLRYKNYFLKKDETAAEQSLHESLLTLTTDDAKRLCVSLETAALMSDEERLLFAAETFSALCKLRDRVSPSSLLVMLFERLHAIPMLYGLDGGEQKVANLYKLIEFARVYEMREEHTLHDFVRELERLYEKEPMEAEASLTSMNAVKIMTVHQAKGLEFPVVFVADMGWSHSFSSPSVLLSPDEGFALKATDEETGVTEAGEFYKRAQEGNRRREQQEGCRIFYVACTRAKDYLFLCGEKKGGGANRSWSGLLNKFKENHADENKEGKLFKDVSYGSVPPAEKNVSPTFYERNKERFTPGALTELNEKERDEQGKCDDAEIFHENFFPLQHFTLSVTGLMNFFACERKFYYGSVLQLDDGDFMPQTARKRKAQKAVSAAEAGLLVHKILQTINFSAKKTDVAEMAERFFTEEWTAKEKREIILRVDSFLRAPFAKNVAKLPPQNVFREQPFFLEIETKNDTHLYVSGIIDLLYEDEEGFHIADYKFAKYDEAHFELYKTQLYLYALAVRNGAGKLPARLHIAFLRDKNKPPVSVDIAGFSDFEKKLYIAAEKLSILLSRQYETSFTKAPRSFCDALSCSFRPLCWGRAEK